MLEHVDGSHQSVPTKSAMKHVRFVTLDPKMAVLPTARYGSVVLVMIVFLSAPAAISLPVTQK